MAIGAASMLLAAPLIAGPTISRAAAATSPNYVPIAGSGSTWSANAITQWISDVKSQNIEVSYTGNGSSAGRQAFLNSTTDFAASDIPFQSQPEDGSQPENPPAGSYAYIPITAGGTSFMYNLHINGQRVTDLRLSGTVLSKIFTNGITNWDDPAIAKDNPQLTLPNRKIVPVVRSDGSGSTAQFVLWMISQYPSIWEPYCAKTGGTHCSELTSFYPTSGAMVAQSGDLGVAGYVGASYAEGAIGYVQYSYALNGAAPVAKILNSAGYYTEPTADNVAVSLLQAKVDTTDVNDPSKYLTENLTGVYTDTDPRTYPLSLYSYLIIPTKVTDSFTAAKGATLAAFADYAMCQGQQSSGSLGYSPMPFNLVEDTFTQIAKIPGAAAQNINIQSCNNPTLGPGGTNVLVTEAPQPQSCDKVGTTQCATGTGGDKQLTALSTTAGGVNPNALVAPTTAPTTVAAKGGTVTPGAVSGNKATSTPSAATNGSSTPAASNGGESAGSATTIPGAAAAVTGGQSGSVAATATTAPAQCNVDTGQCTEASGVSAAVNSGAASAGSGQQASAFAQTVPAPKGWSGTQTLMLLAGLLLLALIIVPGLVYRRLGRKDV